MKKIILMGRSESGKTTLTQALKGEKIGYHKTQYINNFDIVIDTPGEYAQDKVLARALALFTYEADVVGFLCSAEEPYCLFPPGCASGCNREVIGIVTQIHDPDANIPLAINWLELAGASPIFCVDSVTGEGVEELRAYLMKDDNSEAQPQN